MISVGLICISDLIIADDVRDISKNNVFDFGTSRRRKPDTNLRIRNYLLVQRVIK